MSKVEELSIFDMGVEDVSEKREAELPKQKAKTMSHQVKATKPKEEIKVNGDWTIHFATESFTVADFVEEVPEEEITLEELRIELEKSFFQFTATRTRWDVDKENKRLYPDAAGASKGSQ
ncbi:hypothetical protein [Bacillus infantis]|uniref:hypothetical protein n=1 Tax=Bacillus infantis TaxID=324767 RepID=UPI00209D4D3F|nr:hypothetical protein [Bacillus infantis]MCP1161383.1 hypothetical protein [Bacillus infantis]